MDWYIVIKTIKGRRYYYRQKTWREGKHVRTLSQYIGPVGDDQTRPTRRDERTGETRELSISQKLVAQSVDILMGPKATDWKHHWEADRRGPVEVKRISAVEKVIRSLGVQWTHNTQGAYFRPSTGEVNIPPLRCFTEKNGQSARSAYYIVLFHELTHWTKLHIRREDGTSRSLYAREELVAELGAVILMRHFGIEIGNEARHALYFQTWLERTGSQHSKKDAALGYAKVEAERAVRFILERGTMRT